MKITVLLLLFGIFWEGCRLREKHEIKFLSEASGLHIPDEVSDIKYQYLKNADNNYPYDFYSRFKCDTASYLIIQKQISISDQTGRNDANLYISSRMLANDKEYLYAYNEIDWWDVRNALNPEKLYVNYFEDRGKKRIGNSNHFNGKIAVYYRKPYCYLYILCYPPG